jgi:hypothetical protein
MAVCLIPPSVQSTLAELFLNSFLDFSVFSAALGFAQRKRFAQQNAHLHNRTSVVNAR